MFNDITKILKSLKKGVIIMEDGKPSYVLIPFDEYRASIREREYRFQPIDDASLIQRMIAYETSEGEIKAVLEDMEKEKEAKVTGQLAEGMKGINLEDLPF